MNYKIITALLVLCSSANAGLFGPSNFEECILDQMKGIKSDAAANAITFACRAKFPAKDVPKAEQKRYGIPRIDIWDKTLKEDIVTEVTTSKTFRNNGYGGSEISVTNKSRIHLTGVYIGIVKKGYSCERRKEIYDEIYECNGNVYSNTTNNLICPTLKSGWCLVGVKGDYQSDLDEFFRSHGY